MAIGANYSQVCWPLPAHSWQGQWWSAPSDQLYHSPCQPWISWPHTHNCVSALEHWKLRKKGFWLEFSKTSTRADGADSCLAPLTGEFSWSIYVERPDKPPPVHHNLGRTGRPWLEWLWSLYLCGTIHPRGQYEVRLTAEVNTRESPLKILGSDQIRKQGQTLERKTLPLVFQESWTYKNK